VSLSPAFAGALAAARPSFNARAAAARRAQPGFDEAALAAILSDLVDPLVARMAEAAPDRVGAVTDAGFDIALTLAARSLAGPRARRDVVDRLWRDVAPALAAVIAERPYPLLGALTNAALNIAATPGGREGEWLAALAAAAPLATADTLLRVGQVLAWKAGMAHYRAGALAAADSLGGERALALFGAPGDWAEARARLAADRWWRPDGGGAEGVSVGGFTGFGGPFPQPPQVRAGPDGFVARSGARTVLVVADAYGATWRPAAPEAFDALPERPVQLDGGQIRAGDRLVEPGVPLRGLSTAWHVAAGLAIASAYSHRLRVLPWRRP
jgi:hypothetical protein